MPVHRSKLYITAENLSPLLFRLPPADSFRASLLGYFGIHCYPLGFGAIDLLFVPFHLYRYVRLANDHGFIES